MRILIFLVSFFLIFQGALRAESIQSDDPVLVRLNGFELTRSEFEAIYRRNNVEHLIAEPKSIEEYLQVYIDFRLKVEEAKRLGMHNDPGFVRELAGYREQLAAQYMVDREVTEQLIVEAYNRSLYDIRASHILFAVGEHAHPDDTLSAYETAMMVRERALQGEHFATLAREYSDDPAARAAEGSDQHPIRPGNAGDLGYFSVFNMVYPFETAAYNTPVGEISLPARTAFGYHLIKVVDKLPAMGTAKVAHIMLMTPPEMPHDEIDRKENQIRELYNKLVQGADFGELASGYSEDSPTARRRGEMNPFTSNRMVPEFIQAISKLANTGDFSPPVRTAYGWHIIQLIEKVPPPGFDEAYVSLQSKIKQDSRSQLGERSIIERLKKEYAYEENYAALTPFYELIDESVFQANWNAEVAANMNDELFRFAERSYTQQQFANHIADNQSRQNQTDLVAYINATFKRFSEERLLAYERSVLDEKYPAFGQLMQEYHDGILLFEITDKMVWSNAVEDTLGLREFFNEHEANYTLPDRIEAVVFTTTSSPVANEIMQLISDTSSDTDHTMIMHTLNDGESLPRVTMVEGVFEMQELPLPDNVSTGIYGPLQVGGQYKILDIADVLPARPMKLSEVRGQVISDYQNYLEKKWISSLRETYHVYIDYEVLNSIKEEW